MDDLEKMADQNLSPRILLASRMSLLIKVTRWAWYVHKLASSNKETMAASVASWRANKALLWNLNWVSKLRSLTIWRTWLKEKYFCGGREPSASKAQCFFGISWSIWEQPFQVLIFFSSSLQYQRGQSFLRSFEWSASSSLDRPSLWSFWWLLNEPSLDKIYFYTI